MSFFRLAILTFLITMYSGPAMADPSAKLIYFTQDGTASGAPLKPGFKLDSLWSGLGQGADDTVYMAVSNHQETEGNVAIFALDPGAEVPRLLGDVRAFSEAAGNWAEGEGQYKVHSFFQQHADGLIYFATMPATKPETTRGAHIYTLDPATEEIRDLSATAAFTLQRDGTVVPGTGVAAAGQGGGTGDLGSGAADDSETGAPADLEDLNTAGQTWKT